MAIIGIDLGTTNSLAVTWKNGKVEFIPNNLGSYLTPSVVAMEEDGTILVGQTAKERAIKNPENAAKDFKRYMGTNKIISLGYRAFKPEELSSLVLKKLKEDAKNYLREEIEEVVISVPAYFNNDQRYATKVAAKLAGIHCERIINEPSAAALACRFKDSINTEELEEQIYLVFDLGGGTLDVSIVECFENIVEIISIAGDNHLRGIDFDEYIAKAFCNEKDIDFKTLSMYEKAAILN